MNSKFSAVFSNYSDKSIAYRKNILNDLKNNVY